MYTYNASSVKIDWIGTVLVDPSTLKGFTYETQREQCLSH
jgi:hypothetical protein